MGLDQLLLERLGRDAKGDLKGFYRATSDGHIDAGEKGFVDGHAQRSGLAGPGGVDVHPASL